MVMYIIHHNISSLLCVLEFNWISLVFCVYNIDIPMVNKWCPCVLRRFAILSEKKNVIERFLKKERN